MSLICPNCNAHNIDNANFCKSCGANISEKMKNKNTISDNESERNSLIGARDIINLFTPLFIIFTIGVVGYIVIVSLQPAIEPSANTKIIASENNSEINETLNTQEVLHEAFIKDLILNISDAKGNEKLMKLSFSIKSSNETIQAIVDNNKAEITDAVIIAVGSRSAEEMLTLGGKELLREELIKEFNKILNDSSRVIGGSNSNHIQTIVFTDYVVAN